MNNTAGMVPHVEVGADEVSTQLAEAVNATHKANNLSSDAGDAEKYAIECWNRYHEMQEALFNMMGKYAAFNQSAAGVNRPKSAEIYNR